jgi:hypothetical protein
MDNFKRLLERLEFGERHFGGLDVARLLPLWQRWFDYAKEHARRPALVDPLEITRLRWRLQSLEISTPRDEGAIQELRRELLETQKRSFLANAIRDAVVKAEERARNDAVIATRRQLFAMFEASVTEIGRIAQALPEIAKTYPEFVPEEARAVFAKGRWAAGVLADPLLAVAEDEKTTVQRSLLDKVEFPLRPSFRARCA